MPRRNQLTGVRMRVTVALLIATIALCARAEDGDPARPTPPVANLVKQANAPISTIFQVRLQDTFIPETHGVDGQANVLTTAITMPLPEYRLLPIPQLSVLTMPTAVTTPDGTTGFGDLRFVDIAVLRARHDLAWGVGPTFVFPTATEPVTGQGKWQIGPAAALAYTPERWLLGFLVQNPISFAGDRLRKDANTLFVTPFTTYQLGNGWFVRSQPQAGFNWTSRKPVLPIDLGAGRVFAVGRQQINCFVEPFWNVTHDGPTPVWGIQFGVAFLYPNLWHGH